MKNKDYILYQKGSFTIEISLLMPLILSVVLLMLFWLLYMYDLSVMQSAISRGTKQVFYYINENNEVIGQKCSKIILSDLEESLVGVEDVEVTVEVSSVAVEGEVSGCLNVPEILQINIMEDWELWNFEVEWKEPRLNVSEVVLTGLQMKELYSEIVEGDSENEEDESDKEK